MNEAIDRHWRRGKLALNQAEQRLQRLLGASEPVAAWAREALMHLERGGLAEVVAGSAAWATGQPFAEIQAHAAEALAARNQALELAARSCGDSLRELARGFHNSREPDDDLARAWISATRKFYTWRGDGPFAAWLRSTVKRALLDGARATRKVAARAGDRPVELMPDRGGDGASRSGSRGTMTAWVVEMLRCFRDSLEPDKGSLWDDWERMGEDGMHPEEIYRALALRHGKSISAVKMTIHRLEVEFRELLGADRRGLIDASGIVALWIGCERHGPDLSVVVTGIDVDDHVRLLAARRVPRLDIGAFTRILWTLRRWGLPQDRRTLVVIDDSEGLEQAIALAFPGAALVQPCLDRFVERLLAGVPTLHAAPLRQRLRAALAARTPADARRALLAIAAALTDHAPAAGALLHDRLDALLTVKSLQLPAALEAQLTRVEFLASRSDGSANPWPRALLQRLRIRRSVPNRREGLHTLRERLKGPG